MFLAAGYRAAAAVGPACRDRPTWPARGLPAARRQPRGVQDHPVPGRRVGAARHRRAGPGPARRARCPDAVTAAAFGIGALGAAALPVTAGFVAEWALLQALIHGARPGDRAGRRRDAGRGRGRRADRRAGADDLRQGVRDRVPRPAPQSAGATGAHEARDHAGCDARRGGGRRTRCSACVPGLVAEAAARARPVSPASARAAGSASTWPGVERCSTRSPSPCVAAVIAVPVLWLVRARGPASAPARASWRGAAAGSGSARGCSTPRRRTPSRLLRVFDDALRPEPRHRGHPRQRVQVPRRAGAVPASRSTTSSRSGSTGRCCAVVDRCGTRGTPAAERQHPPLPRLLLRSPCVAVLVLVAL